MTLRRTLALTVLATAASISACGAATYYVSASTGSDANSGTSASAPWQTLGKLNGTTFQPGDRILLKAGDTWTGQLWPKGSGSASAWITLDEYGNGAKPLIQSPDGTTEPVMLQGQSYWTIQNLATTGGVRGVLIGSNGVNSPALVHGVHLISLDVSQTAASTGDAAAIHIIPSTAAMDDLLIQGCTIQNAGEDGIWFENINGALSTNVHITGCRIDTTHSIGIEVNASESPLVEHNAVYRCGAYNNDPSQAFAPMFPYGCHNGTFQYNEAAYTAVGGDSQAFDLDNGCSGTFYYQYNYSHDNAGGFFESTNNSLLNDSDQCVIRDNISQNDGNGVPASSGGGLMRLNGKHHLIYNNTFYNDSGPMTVQNWYQSDWGAGTFVNNIFWCPKGFTSRLDTGTTNPFSYDHNLFYGANGPANGTSQLNNIDPQFVSPGQGGDGFSNLSGYQLKPTSPAIAAGAVMSGNGGIDFFGSPVPATGAPDLGAAQHTATAEAAFHGPHAIPGTVEAEDYDTGGQGVGYSVSGGGGQSGYRADNDGDVQSFASDSNGWNVGWTAQGQWTRYTVSVQTAGAYTAGFSVASPSGAASAFHLEDASGSNLSGEITVPNTGAWDSWQTVTANVTLPAGQQTLKLVQDNGGWNIDAMAFAQAQRTYSFGDISGDFAAVDGLHGGIDFGSGQWRSDGSFAGLGRCGYFASAGVTSASFTLPSGRWLRGVRLSGDRAGTYTISDGVNPDVSGGLSANSPVTAQTGWTGGGRKITVTVSAGWDAALTAITY